MQLTMVQYDIHDITERLNDGKNMTLIQLVRDGLLTQEQADKCAATYFPVVMRRGWIGGLFRTKDEQYYQIMTIMAEPMFSPNQEAKK